MKPQNEISRTETDVCCPDCKMSLVRILGEVKDGQGHGGTESVTYLWCDTCGQVVEEKAAFSKEKGLRLTVQMRRALRGDPLTCDHCNEDVSLPEAYRCAWCSFWFHKQCILEHFKES